MSPRDDELFGERIHKTLTDIDGHVDMVNVFRPSAEAPAIATEAAAIGANILWLQAGIVSQEAADIVQEAGMTFIMDLCMGTMLARLSP